MEKILCPQERQPLSDSKKRCLIQNERLTKPSLAYKQPTLWYDAKRKIKMVKALYNYSGLINPLWTNYLCSEFPVRFCAEKDNKFINVRETILVIFATAAFMICISGNSVQLY
jgi:hypothetical protein